MEILSKKIRNWTVETVVLLYAYLPAYAIEYLPTLKPIISSIYSHTSVLDYICKCGDGMQNEKIFSIC